VDPDPGGPKTCGSGFGSGTLQKRIIFVKPVSPAGGSSLLAHWWVIRPKEIRKKKAQTPAQNKRVNTYGTERVKSRCGRM
jgi:hypothetical protein